MTALADALDACLACVVTGIDGGLLEELRAVGGAPAYGLLVTALLLGACGVPIPEEAVFAIGGALASGGRVAWPLVYGLGWAVVLALDAGLFALGARFGPGIERSRLGRRVGAERWAFLQRFIARRGLWAVVGARFVMGIRIPTFLLAGAMGMPWRRFLPAVALAGLVSAAIPVGLGYVLGAHLDELLAALGTARWVLLGLALAVLAWWLVRRRP